jgi:hypothetical protein
VAANRFGGFGGPKTADFEGAVDEVTAVVGLGGPPNNGAAE